jgi:hypothetical protein
MLLDRVISVRTLCVALLLCTVCGQRLHAADPPPRGDRSSQAWRQANPKAVFDGKIANCKLMIANCKMNAAKLEPLQLATPNNQFAIRNLQFAIPFADNGATDQRLSSDDWVRLVSAGEPEEFDEPEFERASSESFGFRHDLRGFLPGVWRDAKGIVRSENMLILGAALAAAIGIRQDLDDEVRHDTAANPDRWGEASTFLGKLGEAPVQVPILGLVWATSLWKQDAELNDLTHTLISAYTINGLSVLVIKGVADTDRPDPDWNGGRWGFPSFHAASSFTIAGVLEEYYGWKIGLPAYTLAGLISWSRVDERDHDLSDVVFGAAMGWVIGKSVAGTHLRNDGRVMLMPWSHPYERAQGVALEVRY